MANCARRDRLVVGDVLKEVRRQEDDAFDASFHDGPYGLGMDKWDDDVESVEVCQELLRACKPGAPLLAFGAPKTHHRLMTNLENAGWKLKDCLIWLYTQGMPKSQYIDGKLQRAFASTKGNRGRKKDTAMSDHALLELTERWEGQGTALKPAWQPIVLAAKPMEGSCAENVAKWGVGGLWIEGCRIPYASEYDRKHQADICRGSGKFFGGNGKSKSRTLNPTGRFPANVMMDEDIAEKLDRDHGETKTAGISRCFFCQPVNKKDKSVDLPEGVENDHKTLKPIELCKHLAQLILPPERDTPRKILVPYAGTGSEMIGALLAGWDHVHGIEIDEHYVELARHRLRYWGKRAGKE